MNTNIQQLIDSQKTEINQRIANAPETANVIAQEVWDSLEHEFNQMVGDDGVAWDFVDNMTHSLSLLLMGGFNDVCSKWVVRPLEQMSKVLHAEAGDAWPFDAEQYNLDNFRWGTQLRQELKPTFDTMFQRTKPSVFTLIGRAIKDEIFDDFVERFDDEMKADGERFRAVFMRSRSRIIEAVTSKAIDLQNKTLLRYRSALSALALETAGA